MDNYSDITQYFVSLLETHRSIDLANSEFRHMLDEDPQLKESYRTWCDENGHSPRHGFRDFADEYLSDRESVWESLNDFDNME
ncbi:MAG: hypothetical protein UHP27_03090 [Muribaculaceae bacterium]|nr:hypothetical protein [Muribaculaceae bacterium]